MNTDDKPTQSWDRERGACRICCLEIGTSASGLARDMVELDANLSTGRKEGHKYKSGNLTINTIGFHVISWPVAG